MDTEVVLTWSPQNWLTVVLMGATFLIAVALIVQVSRKVSASRKTDA